MHVGSGVSSWTTDKGKRWICSAISHRCVHVHAAPLFFLVPATAAAGCLIMMRRPLPLLVVVLRGPAPRPSSSSVSVASMSAKTVPQCVAQTTHKHAAGETTHTRTTSTNTPCSSAPATTTATPPPRSPPPPPAHAHSRPPPPASSFWTWSSRPGSPPHLSARACARHAVLMLCHVVSITKGIAHTCTGGERDREKIRTAGDSPPPLAPCLWLEAEAPGFLGICWFQGGSE